MRKNRDISFYFLLSGIVLVVVSLFLVWRNYKKKYAAPVSEAETITEEPEPAEPAGAGLSVTEPAEPGEPYNAPPFVEETTDNENE